MKTPTAARDPSGMGRGPGVYTGSTCVELPKLPEVYVTSLPTGSNISAVNRQIQSMPPSGRTRVREYNIYSLDNCAAITDIALEIFRVTIKCRYTIAVYSDRSAVYLSREALLLEQITEWRTSSCTSRGFRL